MTEFAMQTIQRPSPFPAYDERVVIEGEARQAMADVAKYFSKERLQQEAIRDERTRLARDLHDGVLQVLTGATLRLEAACGLLDTDPDAARAHFQAVRDLILAEQRALRGLIMKLKPSATPSLASVSELGAALEKLRDQMTENWAQRVHLVVCGQGGIPRTLGDHVYRIVQEGLTNLARHAHAQTASVVVGVLFEKVCVTIKDDGCGFPFHGRHDLASLIARELGPVSLRERVAALHGQLTLNSSGAGSSLEITLPFCKDALFWKRGVEEHSHD